MLFAIEGRVGQRKLWGIVSLAERYPRRELALTQEHPLFRNKLKSAQHRPFIIAACWVQTGLW